LAAWQLIDQAASGGFLGRVSVLTITLISYDWEKKAKKVAFFAAADGHSLADPFEETEVNVEVGVPPEMERRTT